MKHEVKISTLLLGMFLLTQLIGLVVIDAYSPQVKQEVINGTLTNITLHHEIPYEMEPPKMAPNEGLKNIIISLMIAIVIFFILTKLKAATTIKLWFSFISLVTVAIALNGLFIKLFPLLNIRFDLIALLFSIPLTFYKIFKRNLIIHNFTELLIYPGLAVLFVPLLNVWAIILLLFVISFYDMYAVWKSKLMVNLAKYQIKNLKIFTGFFVPYITKEQWKKIRKSKSKKAKKMKISLAILGGGDVAFPLIFAGVILRASGMISSLMVVLFSTLALLGLFVYSRKGKFYPAMPFLTIGCIVGWLVGLLF